MIKIHLKLKLLAGNRKTFFSYMLIHFTQVGVIETQNVSVVVQNTSKMQMHAWSTNRAFITLTSNCENKSESAPMLSSQRVASSSSPLSSDSSSSGLSSTLDSVSTLELNSELS